MLIDYIEILVYRSASVVLLTSDNNLLEKIQLKC